MSHITIHRSRIIDGLNRAMDKRQKRVAARQEEILAEHRGKKTGWPFINRRLMTDKEIIDSFSIWDDYWMASFYGSCFHGRIATIAKMCLHADLITLSVEDVELLDRHHVFDELEKS